MRRSGLTLRAVKWRSAFDNETNMHIQLAPPPNLLKRLSKHLSRIGSNFRLKLQVVSYF